MASALVNTTQQTGGSLGVSLLNTVAASATTGYLASRGGHSASRAVTAAATVHGYTTAFAISGVMLAGAAIVSLLLLRADRTDLPTELEVVPA